MMDTMNLRRTTRPPLIMVVGAFAATTLVAACGSSPPTGSTQVPGVTSDSILMGQSAALTGPVAATCVPIRDGANAWFDKVNSDGGINGRKISVKTLDDGYQATKAVANVRGLLSEGVFALFGTCGTSGSAAAAPLANEAKVPFLLPYAAVDTLYKPVLPYVFAVLPPYSDQTPAITKYVLDHFKTPHPSVYLSLNQAPGYEKVISSTENLVTTSGSKFLGSNTAITGTTDYTPLALKIKAANPDILTVEMGVGDAAILMKAFESIGYFPKAIAGASTMAGEPFIKGGGYLAPPGSVSMVSPIVAAGSPQADSCASALKAKGVNVDAFSLWGCGTAQIAAAAIEKAGKNLTSAALISALESYSNETVSPLFPPLTFSKSQHLGVKAMFEAGIEGQNLVTPSSLIPTELG